MAERLLIKVAVYNIVKKDGDILLLLRQNTGFMDDHWTLPSGHVEKGELPSTAVARETLEESGLNVLESKFVHVLYRGKTDVHHPYVDFFFESQQFEGEPKIPEGELEKCGGMQWFPENQLPENIIPYVRDVLTHIAHGVMFSETVETE